MTSGTVLSLSLQERLVEYDPALRQAWRSQAWWDAGGWRRFLPEAEWERAETMFRTPANGSGDRFVAVMQMRELAEAGLRWRYEGYELFAKPGPTERHTQDGCRLIEAAFSAGAIDRLQRSAAAYRDRDGNLPGTPALFVYRVDGLDIVPVRFIETVHGRSERPPTLQLLGLALIREILGAEVAIVRYAPIGSRATAMSWEMEWQR